MSSHVFAAYRATHFCRKSEIKYYMLSMLKVFTVIMTKNITDFHRTSETYKPICLQCYTIRDSADIKKTVIF